MKKRFLALFFASILILGCVGPVFAADKQIMNLSELVWEEIDDDQVEVMKMFLTTRATQRIDADIAAGKTVKDVTFKGDDGTFKEKIQVSMTGTYYLAIRNNSKSTVSVVGFVYY